MIISSGVSIAGLSHDLVCSASVVQNLITGPILTWEGPGVGQDAVELSGRAMDTSTYLSLTFSPLRTSHGGVYTCTARLNISEAGVDVTGTSSWSTIIQSNFHFCDYIFSHFSITSFTSFSTSDDYHGISKKYRFIPRS